MCGLVSRQTWLPSKWISVYLCVSVWRLRNLAQRCLNGGNLLPSAEMPSLLWHKKTEKPTDPFACPPLWPLAFLPATIWSSLNKVYHFIQTFRVRVRTYEYLPYPFWMKSKTGWHLFSRSGWAAIQVDSDGNVMNSWSGSKDCQNTHPLQP